MDTVAATGARRLAICVDDIGQHDGIDRAALDLFAQGRISAVSALTQGPSWPGVVPALRALPPHALDIGLHFNLTESLGQTVALGSLGSVVGRACARLLNTADLRQRFERQLDAFEAGLGRPPAHVDGHQHVHQLPQVRDVVLQVLAQRYAHLPGSERPWLRSCAARGPAGATAPTVAQAQRKAAVIAALGAGGLRRRAHAAGWQMNAALLGVYNLRDTAGQYPGLLDAWLDAACDGDLLMCHPGLARPGDALAQTRQTEFDLLRAPDFAHRLASRQIRLQPLSQTLRGPATTPAAAG